MEVNEGKQDLKEAKKSYFSKVCYVFLGLTIAFVLIFIFWTNQSNKSSESEFVIPPPSTLYRAEDNTTCPVWSLVGDGYCDDEANIAECGHDFDDCCQVENDRSLCQNCLCILSNSERQVIKDENCGSFNFYLGDGICDLAYNNAANFFDVGDCCLTIQDLMCRQEIIYPGNYVTSNYVTCPDNLCIESNNFCIPEQLGDGICQDHNNGPFCDFDLGDCCLNLSLGNDDWNEQDNPDCCSCSCHGGPSMDINLLESIFSDMVWK